MRVHVRLSGYQQKEARRESDKLYREYLADRLRATKTLLTDAMLELTAHDGLNLLGTIDYDNSGYWITDPYTCDRGPYTIFCSYRYFPTNYTVR